MGIPHTKIDWASWLDVKERTLDHITRFWFFGDKRQSFSEWLSKQFLEPTGAFVTLKNGKIGLDMPRVPFKAAPFTDAPGTAFQLNINGGSVTYMTLGQLSTLSGNTSCTVNFWYHRDGPGGGSLLSLGRVIGSMHFYTREQAANLVMNMPNSTADNSTLYTTDNSPLQDNVWQMVTFIIDYPTGGHKIMVNAVDEAKTLTGTITASSMTVHGGSDPNQVGAFGAYFNGVSYTGLRTANAAKFAELMIFDRALTQAEVTELYNAGTAKLGTLYTIQSEIEHYWRPTGIYPTVNDLKGSNNGTVAGAGAAASIMDASGPPFDDGVEATVQKTITVDDLAGDFPVATLEEGLEGGGIEFRAKGNAVITHSARDFANTYGSRNEYSAETAWKVFNLQMFRSAESAFLERVSTKVLFRWHAPGVGLLMNLHAKHIDITPGDVFKLTLLEVPDGRRLRRGLTDSPFVALRSEPKVFNGKVMIFARQFGPPVDVRALAPSAYINTVTTNTATVDQNRYTSSNHHDSSLVTRDSLAFVVGDQCRLTDYDGSAHAAGPQEITAIEGNDITFDGNFGGSLATGKVIELAAVSASDPRRSYAPYMAGTDLKFGSFDDEATYWGEL